jgi:hypothetical protein
MGGEETIKKQIPRRLEDAINNDAFTASKEIPRRTQALIDRIESGKEPLKGPFYSKEELWKSLEI